MELVYTKLYSLLIEEFLSIIWWDGDTKTLWETWYKMYLYIYLFGSISEEEFPLVFGNDCIYQEKSENETKNAYRSRVRYWGKKREIVEKEKGYYILSHEGLKKIYEDFICYVDLNIDFDKFKQEYFKKNKNFLHARNTSISVFKILELTFNYNFFACEPIINYKGEILTGKYREFTDRVVIPDAVIGTVDGNYIFVEADNCTERMNSALIPKFANYANVIGYEANECSKTTIHFTVWNKEVKSSYHTMRYGVKKLVDLYFYVASYLGNNQLTFAEFTRKHEEIPKDLVKRVNENLEDIPCGKGGIYLEELIKNIEMQQIRCAFSKKFMTRQNYIFDAATKSTLFCAQMLKGTRMICIPIDVSKMLLMCIYLEHVSEKHVLGFLEKYGFKKDRFKGRTLQKEFMDYYYDGTFFFKNVFEYYEISSECYSYVAIENISEDYSGRYRVLNFLKNCRRIEEDLTIICLYNENTLQKLEELVRVREKHLSKCKMKFINYETFLEGIYPEVKY